MKNKKIYPYRNDQVTFWAKKWGIKNVEINEAIISTGSLRTSVIKNYLVKKGSVVSLSGIVYNLKLRFKNFVAKWNEDEEF